MEQPFGLGLCVRDPVSMICGADGQQKGQPPKRTALLIPRNNPNSQKHFVARTEIDDPNRR
jgi:hypothetical protein